MAQIGDLGGRARGGSPRVADPLAERGDLGLELGGVCDRRVALGREATQRLLEAGDVCGEALVLAGGLLAQVGELRRECLGSGCL